MAQDSKATLAASEIERLDSRRLPGPNLFFQGAGAVIDARVPKALAPALIGGWQRHLVRALGVLEWPLGAVVGHANPGGVSLAFEAPIDTLYAATEVNEWAFAAARAELLGTAGVSLDAALPDLQRAIAKESQPHLAALSRAADEQGVCFLHDPGSVSVGMGGGARLFPRDGVPSPDNVDWDGVHDVPVALVTGTNGKSTTVRLLAAIAEHGGLVPGLSSTDWIRVGGHVLDEGDWSGPGGARRVLRDPRTEIGILETARGGILRRGLALRRADTAVVLNVAADHLGEWGVWDVEHLADAKMVVTKIVGPKGRCVLNADDPLIAARAARVAAPIGWFSLRADLPLVRGHLAAGGAAAYLDGDELVLHHGERRQTLIDVEQMPLAMGGAALHNIANALAAALAADAVGIGAEAIARGLAAFGRNHAENPGRLVVFELGGVRAVVDFAHNPHGQEALLAMADRLPATRRLVVLGQAGDRDNESVDELVRITWRHRPDLILIKEMRRYLRGRPPGEMTGRIEAELRRQGARDADFEHVPSEIAALERALKWSKPGDLLMLFAHAEREATIAYLEGLVSRGWRPGDSLPPLPAEGTYSDS
ncbi:MAG: Mur ligase [Planctomycetaceae bacterium]|nr:Mur ligase [Planctomycetaceae bacterium]